MTATSPSFHINLKHASGGLRGGTWGLIDLDICTILHVGDIEW